MVCFVVAALVAAILRTFEPFLVHIFQPLYLHSTHHDITYKDMVKQIFSSAKPEENLMKQATLFITSINEKPAWFTLF